MLAAGLVVTLVLPVGIAVIAGLGGLLGALGDGVGAAVCGRSALAIGVVWMAAVVGTMAATTLAVLDSPPPARAGRRHRRRRPRPDRRPLQHEPPERPS